MDRRQERVDEIVKLFQETDDWFSRSQLADKLGRRLLNQTDIAALTVLELLGVIEVDRRKDPRPAGVIFYYRLRKDRK